MNKKAKDLFFKFKMEEVKGKYFVFKTTKENIHKETAKEFAEKLRNKVKDEGGVEVEE